MSSIIPRIYASYGNALDAAAELKKNGYGDGQISVISNAPNREPGAEPEPLAAIAAARIPTRDVEAFANLVARGKTLLVVRPMWGMAMKAINIIGRHGPIESGVGASEYSSEEPKPNDKSFFSAIFGWPMLLNDPTPFSQFWKWPVLLDDAAPFSKFFNMSSLREGYIFGKPKLLNNSTPFSKELRIPVLLK